MNAKKFFAHGDYTNAFKEILKIRKDIDAKDDFLITLATAHLLQRNTQDASKVTREICYDITTKEVLLAEIAFNEYMQNNKEGVKNALKELLIIALEIKPYENWQNDELTRNFGVYKLEKMKANETTIHQFYDELAQNTFVECIEELDNQNEKNLLKAIYKITKHPQQQKEYHTAWGMDI